MKDLIDYQQARINALTEKINEYERFILELTDKDCTDEYRSLIREEVLNLNYTHCCKSGSEQLKIPKTTKEQRVQLNEGYNKK